MKLDGEGVEAHNEFQRTYFENADHRTLRRSGSVYLRRHVERMQGTIQLHDDQPGICRQSLIDAGEASLGRIAGHERQRA